MADVSPTAANVKKTSTTIIEKRYLAGATLAQLNSVYLDATTLTWKLAQNDGTEAEAAVKGLMLNAAESGQPVDVAVGGSIDPGATLTVGFWYGLSAAAGKICPISDWASAQRHSLVGYASAAAVLELHCIPAATASAADVT